MTSAKLLPLFLLLLTGCAQVFTGLDLNKKEARLKNKTPPVPISCSRPSQLGPALVGGSAAAQQAFRDFLKNLQSTTYLDFPDRAVFWALFQMKIRPDFASPTSRLQFLTRTQHGTRYWDFTANAEEDGVYPYLHGLNSFLQGHKSKHSLEWFAGLLDQHFKGGLTVDKGLENSLQGLKEGIAADPGLRHFWFRGDELLREDEGLPTVPLLSIIRDWRKKPSKVSPAPPFFSYRRTPKLDMSCNYDLTLYDNSIFLIDKEENQGHLFGISWLDQSFFAVSSQRLSSPVTLQGTPFFQGSPKVRSTAFCVVQRPEGEVWLAANQSRDPGQHLYHLFRYGLGKVERPSDLEKLLRHARHMFLSDPLRLVIESARSRPDQVTELLKLNVPIYNATAIGNIWAWAHFKEDGGRFFIDDRNPGTLLCPP